MKILVLGASGFIGNNALHHFRKKYPNTMGCDILPPLVYDPNFLVLNRDLPEFDKVFLQYTFDICINASGSGSVDYSLHYPDIDYVLNAKNVFDILNSISRFNSRCRFINFSSAAVYGNPDKLPIAETAPTKPMSPYGFHKLMSEQVCREFFYLKKINTCSLRVFSAYGPKLHKQLFWDIYQKFLQGPVINLYGTGEETRDFIHIEDLLFALDCVIENSSFTADVINVASGNSVSIREAAETFLKQLGGERTINFTGHAKEGDPQHWLADISKLRSFGFSPAIDLEKGLYLYVEWLRQSGMRT